MENKKEIPENLLKIIEGYQQNPIFTIQKQYEKLYTPFLDVQRKLKINTPLTDYLNNIEKTREVMERYRQDIEATKGNYYVKLLNDDLEKLEVDNLQLEQKIKRLEKKLNQI